MSVLRSSGLLVVLVVLLPALAGCGGAAAPGASSSVPAGSTRAPASQPAEPTVVDASLPVANPPIVDGAWTSGKWHVEISGDVTATRDDSLAGGFNVTTAGTTLLAYADPTTGDGGGVIIGPEVNGITLSSAAVSLAGGDSGDANVCTVVVTQADASRLAGTFDCKRLLGVVASASRNVTVDVRGTFEASR
jgi:hypothetical protein